MKRFLSLLLVLVMCVGVFAGCNKNKDEATAATLEQAKDYLYNIMKDKNDKATPNDYDVVGKIIIDSTTFEVTWKTDNENIVVKESSKANCWTIDVPSVNETEVKYTLTATIKNAAGETIEVSFTPKLPVINNAGVETEFKEGVAYKIFMKQINLGYTVYALNTTQDGQNKYIETTLDPKEAATFYVEVVDGGYKIYTEIDGVKNYLHAELKAADGGKVSKYIGFSTESNCVFSYDKELSLFKVTIDGGDYGVGTYNNFATISISEITYFKADNINVEDGQFPIGLYTKEYADTLAPSEKPEHVHEYVDGFCSCGEADPNATVTNQAPILTAETLGLGAYADGSKTLGGVQFDFIELGTYGDGIQWRNKAADGGKTSTLWNATATPMGIEKIEITLADGKTGFSNTDALVFKFGDSAENLTYTTTMSTEKDVAKYTITPDAGTYKFFKIQINITYTVYIERITISYTGGAAHVHEFVDGECACGESDPDYVPSHTCADANGDFICDATDCDKVVAPAADSTLTLEQANAFGVALGGSYSSDKYYVTGTITSVYNTQYGNMYIKNDNDVTFTIYGVNGYSSMANKPVAGDVITVYGTIGSYSGAAQTKNADMTDLQHTHAFTNGECACGATDPDYVPTHTCVDDNNDYVCDATDCDKYLLPEEGTVLTIAEALKIGALYKNESGASYAPYKYYIVGEITDLTNTTYGTCKITDATGTIDIYGLKDSTGSIRYDALDVKPIVGDTVKIYGELGAYRQSVQFNNSNIIEHTHTCEFVDGKCACGETDPNYVPTHTCVDENNDYVCDATDCNEYVLPEEGTVLTIAEALKIGALYKNSNGASYAPYKYYIVGQITDLTSTKYGTCKITDATGTIDIYGLKDSTGSTIYEALAVKPIVGDTVKIYGELGAFKQSVQFNNSNIIEHTAHTCEYGADDKCTACGVLNPDHTHSYTEGSCVCGATDPDYNPSEGGSTQVILPENLTFANAANKASADTYMKDNYSDWKITGKLGQTYVGYLGFGRNGDRTSAIKSSEISVNSAFTITTVLKGNGSSGVATSTLTFTLVDASGNLVATGYANGSATAAITPADAKDTTYNISFTLEDGKSWSDVSNLVISFQKSTGNIGLKSLTFVQ